MSVAPSLESQFGTRELRDALGMFATGIVVVTARDPDERPIGLTVNSFNSVSLDPPLVLWSLSVHSPLRDAFERCSHYAINVLAEDQEALSQRFASSDPDRFDGLEHTAGTGGAPLLPGCCAWLECANHVRYPGGDHVILLGRVARIARADKGPLLYFRGQYHLLLRDF